MEVLRLTIGLLRRQNSLNFVILLYSSAFIRLGTPCSRCWMCYTHCLFLLTWAVMWIKLSAWCLNLKDSIIRAHFPPLRIGVSYVQYVSNFKYLGHIIMDNLSDDGDIRREIPCMFTRCNMLRRRFYNCSMSVKLFYNRPIALCNKFLIGVMNRPKFRNTKCV